MIKNPNEMTAEERIDEITSILACGVIRLIESKIHQANYLDNERSLTGFNGREKPSCVHKNKGGKNR